MRFRVGETEDIFDSRPVRTFDSDFYVNVGPERIYTSKLSHVNYPEPEETVDLNSDERNLYHEKIAYPPEQDSSIEENLLELYQHVGSWFGASPKSFRWLDKQLEEAANESQMEHMLENLVKAGYMEKQEISGENVYFPEAKFADEDLRKP
jgi:hypothetical protein